MLKLLSLLFAFCYADLIDWQSAKTLGQYLPRDPRNGSPFEPSGVHFLDGMMAMLVVNDQKEIAVIDRDGNILKHCTDIPVDLEGITVIPDGGRVIVVDELHNTFVEVSLVTCSIIKTYTTNESSSTELASGYESATFIENAGVLATAIQDVGDILFYELPSEGTVAKRVWDTVRLDCGTSHCGVDLSGMWWDNVRHELNVLYDTGKVLKIFDSAFKLNETYTMLGDNNEGIAFSHKTCEMYLARDKAGGKQAPTDETLVIFSNWSRCERKGNNVTVDIGEPPVDVSNDEPSPNLCSGVTCSFPLLCDCSIGKCCLATTMPCNSNDECCSNKCSGRKCKGPATDLSCHN